ncbi:MAG: PBP1A family penicillin-binding protein [Hyphomicrobiaceae bacterium]
MNEPAGIAAADAVPGPTPEAPRRWLARHPRLSRALLLAPVYVAALATIFVSIQLIRYTIRFPDPRMLTVNEPGPRLRILARDGSVIAERGDGNDFIPLDRLPRHLVDAVIAIEDRRFFSHWGLDPAGLVRAALANLRAGRTAQGGSTLTQQLAKNLFLTTERTLSRKLDEMVLALWLEIRLSKREILELYLNRVYFGGGAYGVEAAAKRFFGKSARSVNVAEAAVIAGLLKAPTRYSPFVNPGYARHRARVVIQAMLAARLVSPISAAAATRQSVHFSDADAGKSLSGLEYAVDYVLDRLPPLASVAKRQVVIETTIDPDIQRRAQSSVATMLEKEGPAAKVGQAAVVVLDTGGGIRALVGGRSFAESQFDRAAKARRQPGSAFKPFVYLAALENGFWPDTPVVDEPIEIGEWSPRNYDGRFRGPITLTQALAHSVNTVAVRLQQQVGSDKVADMARRLGIRSPLRPDASMALGTSEVGLLELCAAYGTLAAGGLGVEPFVVRRIRTDEGEVLFERHAPSPRMLVAPDTVGAINTMLNAAIVSGTGRRAAFPTHQTAGKTGTTQDFRDAWFVGYTAHLVAGVWFGNDDGSPMNRVTGGSLPALVWRDVMQAAHASLLPRALPAVDGAVIDPTKPAEPGEQRRVSGLPAPALGTSAEVAPLARSKPTTPSASAVVAVSPDSAIARRRTRASATVTAEKRTPPRNVPRRKVKAAARPPETVAPPAPLRMPARQIDPEFFARALALPAREAEASTKPSPPPSDTKFDARRIRERLGFNALPGWDQRMGLGAHPVN